MADNPPRADRDTESKRRLAGGEETAGWDNIGIPARAGGAQSR